MESSIHLQAVYDELNARYFKSSLRCSITWGRRQKKAKRRSICYGSYDRSRRLIRINPLLDAACVEPDFIKYIVYHEMLHAAIPVERKNGRNQIHPPVFRTREKMYPNWYRMRLLSKQYLKSL